MSDPAIVSENTAPAPEQEEQKQAKRARAPRATKPPAAAAASEKLAGDKAKIDADRKVLRDAMKPAVASLGEAMEEVANSVNAVAQARATVEISHRGFLADALYDLAFFMLEPSEKDVPQLAADATAARMLVRFARMRKETNSEILVKDKDDAGNVITLRRTTLAMEIPPGEWLLAAKLALLRALPNTHVRHGWLPRLPSRQMLPVVDWQEFDNQKGGAVAYCVERHVLFPHRAIEQVPETDPPQYLAVGEATSTALKAITEDRVNVLYAMFWEHKTPQPRLLPDRNGRPPSGELYVPALRQQRTPNAGTGAQEQPGSALDLTNSAMATAFKNTLLAIAVACRDAASTNPHYRVIMSASDLRAAMFAACHSVIARECQIGTLKGRGGEALRQGDEGFELVTLYNNICSMVTDEVNGVHYLYDDTTASKRGPVIGNKGSGILKPARRVAGGKAKAA